MKINLLIIDDHPTQIEGYKAILGFNESNHELHFVVAHDCESAFHLITNPINKSAFDVIFLDWSLPPFHAQKIMNGEDLGVLIRKHIPKAKIILMTSHSEGFILYNIVKKCSPEALMVKSDFTAEDLLKAFESVIAGKPYTTQTVRENMLSLASKTTYLDNHNRKIIQLLAEGVKTKNIPQLVALSQSAVEKRKVNIKDYFGILNGGDEEIVKEAKVRGYI